MTDCKRVGIERCGLDVKCAACTKEHHPSGYSAEYVEQLAVSATETPYFDIDGNEGTLEEVHS